RAPEPAGGRPRALTGVPGGGRPMKRSCGPGYRPAVVWLALLAAFAAGVGVERAGWLPGADRRPPPGLGRTFAPFWETWHLVQAYYVDRDAVQPEHMTQGAIE